MTEQRVLIIGWDGASLDLLKPWADSGELPHLAALLERGASGRLESVVPIVSPAAWTSMLTGVQPETHRVFGFVHPEAGTNHPKLTSAFDRQAPALWEILSEAGIDSSFLWVPATYPPEPLRGLMVSGMGTPGIYSEFTFPGGLKPELLERFGPKIMEPDIIGRSPEEYLDELLENILAQGQAAEYLIRENGTRLSMVVFTQSDRVQHFFWDQMTTGGSSAAPASRGGAILRVYKELDRVLGALAALLSTGDYLLLVSDHGAGPVSKEVDVNLLLHKLGLLYFENELKNAPSIGYLVRSTWSKSLRSLSLAARARLPRQWVARLQNMSQAGALSRLREASADPVTHTIDWERTQLFAIDSSGALYCAAGQEHLPADEWKAFEERVSRQLLAFRDPETGHKVAKSVRRLPMTDREDSGALPAFAIDWEDGYFGSLSKVRQGDIVGPPSQWPGAGAGLRLSSYHRINGILAAAGPGISAKGSICNATLVDVVPTVLTMLGHEPAAYLQGAPLWAAIASA